MIHKLTRQGYLLFSLLAILINATNCANTRNVVYFSGQGDTAMPFQHRLLEYPIQPSDLLSVTVSSLNPEASEIFNTPNISNVNYTPSTSGNVQSSGYLVNTDGFIQFPIIGKIKAQGLTKSQLGAEITNELLTRNLLVDPIVNVRNLNFKVTVLGEVNRPTVINVPNERITLLEALGLAGDVTIYGKKDNVMVIREVENKKHIKRLNLNSKELFSSPYYYLMPNDILYIEPTKAKVTGASNTRQWLPLVLSGLSFAAIIVSRVLN